MDSRRARTGFTLVEMLVVMVIATLVVSLGYTATRNRMAGNVADSFVQLQAREMAEFGAAVEKFVGENAAAWPQNIRQQITAAQVISAGHLPATWATRGGSAGATPIGELYRAFALKDAQNVTRIVVADFGRTPTDALVRRAGYQATAASLLGFKARVADRFTQDTGGDYAAYVAAGTSLARGPGGAFEQNLAAYLGTPLPTLPLAVTLVGWPEYRRPGGREPEGGSNRQCTVVAMDQATACIRASTPSILTPIACSRHLETPSFGLAYVGPSCPAGTTLTEVIPACTSELVLRNVAGLFTITAVVGAFDTQDATGHKFSSFCENQTQMSFTKTGVRTFTQSLNVNASTVATAVCGGGSLYTVCDVGAGMTAGCPADRQCGSLFLGGPDPSSVNFTCPVRQGVTRNGTTHQIPDLPLRSGENLPAGPRPRGHIVCCSGE